MSCNKFSKFGLLYFYKELGDKETKKFEKHLKECKVCRNQLKELEDTVELYEKLPEESPSSLVLNKILKISVSHRVDVPMKSGTRIKQFLPGTLFREIPPIKIFQIKQLKPHIPRPVFAGIGVVVILLIVSYFLSQEPKPYLEWDYAMDSKIEVIEEDIYDLHEEAGVFGALDKILLDVEQRIEGVREKIKNLEEELQTW